MINHFASACVGYGLGSILVSSHVARRHGIDLHRVGGGNPGAWNALEQLGARRAWPAFVGDGAKAFAAGMVGHALGGWWAAWTGVAGAMVGHAAPLGRPSRGGKSVMCFAGGAFALSPTAALGCLGLAGLVTARHGFFWGARAGVFAFPLLQFGTDPVEHVAATGVLMTLIGVLFLLRRHRSALARTAQDAASRS